MYKYLFLIFFYLSSCIHFQNYEKSTGNVYGQLVLNPRPYNLKTTLTKVIITIKPPGTKITPDSIGIFSIDKIPQGKYSIEAAYTNYRNVIIKNVDVKKDSTSLLFIKLNGYNKKLMPDVKLWKELKIRSVDINTYGRICGLVMDIDSQKLLTGLVNIIIEDTFWGTVIDSNGYFCIKHILPGEYTLKSSSIGYHNSVYTNVRVLPNQASIVNFKIQKRMIPEAPLPVKWKESYKPIFENN